jgi:hypothetical protein
MFRLAKGCHQDFTQHLNIRNLHFPHNGRGANINILKMLIAMFQKGKFSHHLHNN